MQKDDYFVIVYNVLRYLYEQLKDGTTTVDCPRLIKDLGVHIKADYWLYIVNSLLDGKYITGKTIEHKYIDSNEPVADNREVTTLQITPKGIECLYTPPMMKQAKDI